MRAQAYDAVNSEETINYVVTLTSQLLVCISFLSLCAEEVRFDR